MLHFKIVTPERVVYENDVKQATIPTKNGEITVLPNHVALVSVLNPGELMVIEASTDKHIHLAVSGGLIEITNNQVVVLADTAERSEEIDEARAAVAHQRAQELLASARNQADVDYTGLASQMEKELARLKVARKHHSHQHHELNS